ncbi:MAG: amino acid decarboxylase [Lachnospiraceae bacterium]|nr:amino acid decarboxylase [Lachnospiraceae bacterium]
METPIYSFVADYMSSGMSRFHMPGHKGQSFLGCECRDITEIEGADVLSMASGVIAESQDNASHLFCTGSTLYSAEGSSLCIKAMLMAVLGDARKHGSKGNEYILAARNVHRSMIDACALLGIETEFIINNHSGSICESMVAVNDIENALNIKKREGKHYPVAVYITSPGYLGDIADVEGIASICEKYSLPLIVDNAHGAYLAFLEESRHPIKLGAAICCDSAHKTLPVLTGGAYLHISGRYKERYMETARRALALFGSTSPSYLVLQSLDLCNKYIAGNYRERLAGCINAVNSIKGCLKSKGICIMETEPLKIVINTACAGYTGTETGIEMREYGIECEYADIEYVVLMVTPENTKEDFERIRKWAGSTFLIHNKKNRLVMPRLSLKPPKREMSIREAVFSTSVLIDVKVSSGRICAAETVSCPPAVPIAVCGEVINQDMVKLFEVYNIKKVCVVDTPDL